MSHTLYLNFSSFTLKALLELQQDVPHKIAILRPLIMDFFANYFMPPIWVHVWGFRVGTNPFEFDTDFFHRSYCNEIYSFSKRTIIRLNCLQTTPIQPIVNNMKKLTLQLFQITFLQKLHIFLYCPHLRQVPEIIFWYTIFCRSFRFCASNRVLNWG